MPETIMLKSYDDGKEFTGQNVRKIYYKPKTSL